MLKGLRFIPHFLSTCYFKQLDNKNLLCILVPITLFSVRNYCNVFVVIQSLIVFKFTYGRKPKMFHLIFYCELTSYKIPNKCRRIVLIVGFPSAKVLKI